MCNRMMRKRKSAAISLAAAVLLMCCLAQTIDCYRLRKTERREGRKEADSSKTIGVQEGKIVFGRVFKKGSGQAIDGTKKPSSNASMEDEADYQADFASWPQGQVQDPSSVEAAWKVMSPSLHCGGDQLKFSAVGPGTSQFEVERENASPMSLSQVPGSCGYGMQRNPLGLVLLVPYDGCNVAQEGGSYLLPLRWKGIPVILWCRKPAAHQNPQYPTPLYPKRSSPCVPPSHVYPAMSDVTPPSPCAPPSHVMPPSPYVHPATSHVMPPSPYVHPATSHVMPPSPYVHPATSHVMPPSPYVHPATSHVMPPSPYVHPATSHVMPPSPYVHPATSHVMPPSPYVYPKVHPDISQFHPRAYPDISQLHPRLHPDIPQLHPRVHPQLHPRAYPQVHPDISQLHPRAYPQVHPAISQLHSREYPQVHPAISQVHPRVYPKLHTQLYPIVPQVHPMMHNDQDDSLSRIHQSDYFQPINTRTYNY